MFEKNEKQPQLQYKLVTSRSTLSCLLMIFGRDNLRVLHRRQRQQLRSVQEDQQLRSVQEDQPYIRRMIRWTPKQNMFQKKQLQY